MYISTGDLRTYLGITSATQDSTSLTLAVAHAQKEIESYCKRVFESSTGTRYYRETDLLEVPFGSQFRAAGALAPGRYSWDASPGVYSGPLNAQTWLRLDEDLLSVDELKNGDSTGTVIPSTGYWLEPRNETPRQFIRLRSTHQWVFGTDGEISVAGTWGYSTGAPADIVRATLELAAYIYRLKDSQTFDVTAAPDIGVITVPQGVPRHVRRVLDDGGYRRKARFA